MILQAASGINVIVWFAWDDRDWVHLPFVRSDFQTPTPAAVAFQQVQSWLMSASITCTNTPDGTWQCPVTARGVQKYIVWNTDATTTFRIPASWQVKTANDLAGNSQAISDGSVTIGHLPIMLSP
jgi:phosphoglycerol transferase MdoB-like AlkP superfamily enzyme